jgi:hypothetical protein
MESKSKKKKKKDMIIKQGQYYRGGELDKGGGLEMVMGEEYYQSTLYACMKTE